ncbi:MAG TPA: hypothetical protein VFT24_00720, partial [Vicinamibacterales bacterium]|nr:hypothetical protein [Vicinamibacterales bacterium]
HPEGVSQILQERLHREAPEGLILGQMSLFDGRSLVTAPSALSGLRPEQRDDAPSFWREAQP